MKLPLSTLKQFTNCDISANKILSIISSKIGEVEEYSDISKAYEGVYVGQIVKKEEHPNADKLGIYELNIGEKDNIQVVAGDKTLSVGDKVAYIKPGNIVPYTYGTGEPIKIRAANMRGITSNGMLCSEKELNIGSNHKKVLVLPTDAPVGTPFSEYYELNDTVIDIENKALTNRGDLFGILGLAREISAAQNIPFTSPKWYLNDSTDIHLDRNRQDIYVDNQASNLCPRYTCITMDGIEIKDSPIWLKSILLKSGIKPINNVVDITNYLSILTGQPLHAFDYDKLVKNDINSNGSAHITVRVASQGEKIHTLDGNVVELTSNNLVIADSTNPIAIAGVIGGIDTEIDSNTKRVIIESANFNKFSIRKTSMEHGIFTDAVTRYTRGQHPFLCRPILLKAISLIEELANGEVSSNIVDIYPEVQKQENISFSIYKLNTHLGTNLSKQEIESILNNLEYKCIGEDSEYITVTPPIFRTDIYIPEDIYEDIARIYGYENILPKLPIRDTKASKLNNNIELKKKIRSILSNSGCNEIDTYNFVSKESILNSNQDPNISYHIKNALSPDLAFMRPSLLVSLLEKAKYNVQKNVQTFCIYEFNIPHQIGYIDNFQLPKEDWHLSLLFSSKDSSIEGNPYYQVKKYFEKISNSLGIDSLKYELVSESSELDIPIWIKNIIPSFDSNSTALIKYYDNGVINIIGIVGDLNRKVKDSFKLPTFTSAFEINLEEIKRMSTRKRLNAYESKFPAITQDICFTVNDHIKYIQLEEIVVKTINTKDRIGSVECIDIYKKEDDKKNITIRVQVEDKDKTLSDKEFEKIREKIELKVKEIQ